MNGLEIWRICIIVGCGINFTYLMYRYAKHSKEWNSKTRDYWFALSMWSFAGLSISTEGLIRGSSFRVSMVFLSFAAVVSIVGLLKKGSWGGS